jgi:hypothetical protein
MTHDIITFSTLKSHDVNVNAYFETSDFHVYKYLPSDAPEVPFFLVSSSFWPNENPKLGAPVLVAVFVFANENEGSDAGFVAVADSAEVASDPGWAVAQLGHFMESAPLLM